MKNNIKNLYNEFIKIKNIGWIKSKRKGSTGIGYTFEKLLNKEENNLEFPDYNNIEIKTKHKYSKGFITLFNANPDGDYLFPIESLIKNFGYNDKQYPQYKVFNMSLNTLYWSNIGNKRKMKLLINNEKKTIDLICKDTNNNFITTDISWSFDMLKEKLERKDNYLCLVHAHSKFINEEEYFKYDVIEFYKLKSFDNFLNLISNGIIRITFKIGIFKFGERFGQIHNHGTGFDINEKNMNLLYKKIK